MASWLRNETTRGGRGMGLLEEEDGSECTKSENRARMWPRFCDFTRQRVHDHAHVVGLPRESNGGDFRTGGDVPAVGEKECRDRLAAHPGIPNRPERV